MSIIDNYYKLQLESFLCQKTTSNSKHPAIGECYKIVERIGRGCYWIYDSKKRFNMKIHENNPT